MLDLGAIEKSKALYEAAKKHFAPQNLADCVIEISDKPFEEWVVHFPESKDQMSVLRMELSADRRAFIAISAEAKKKYFFFADHAITKCEILNTGEVVLFDLENFSEFSMEQIKKEFAELKKILRGA